MARIEIDNDEWWPVNRAGVLVRQIDGIKFTDAQVLDRMAREDKKIVDGNKPMVRAVAFRAAAQLVAASNKAAREAEPTAARLADRVTALEAQRVIDLRRIDQAIEALQKQLDRSNDFASILTK